MRIQMWDTAGQERFRSLATSSFRGIHAFVVLFDISSRASFEHVNRWLDCVRDNSTNAPWLLCGAKSDLRHVRAVSVEQAVALAGSLGALSYVEVSAKTGDAVEECIAKVARSLCGELTRFQARLDEEAAAHAVE
eukprot:TRINITY_DN4300_c0_g1_i1.p1 TRINITY_DN4300_c0_g1~~TRINITY_DN4300_c0_g1_i1.p1  ORF type:complete len:135 (+),score=25.00 TRINITY_DN4300_c0_g1_i1:444-848(+)